MSWCGSRGVQHHAEEGKSNEKGGGIMATKRELEERIEELEEAIEKVKSVSDKALDSDNADEEELE
jgi:hypothetical protein